MRKMKDAPPTEEGFYWCVPAFSNVGYMECDGVIKPEQISIAQVVTLKRSSMGSNLFVRFIGHKLPHSLNSEVIKNTKWGSKIVV